MGTKQVSTRDKAVAEYIVNAMVGMEQLPALLLHPSKVMNGCYQSCCICVLAMLLTCTKYQELRNMEPAAIEISTLF